MFKEGDIQEVPTRVIRSISAEPIKFTGIYRVMLLQRGEHNSRPQLYIHEKNHNWRTTGLNFLFLKSACYTYINSIFTNMNALYESDDYSVSTECSEQHALPVWEMNCSTQAGRVRALTSMSDESLELLSAAFADFMTPEEDGTPILLTSDLKHALNAVGIPGELSGDLEPLMDPEQTGKITFEQFAEACQGQISGAPQSEGDNSSDEDYVEDSASNEKRKHVFSLLSNKKGHITVKSLQKASQKLKLNVPESDLQKMVGLVSNEGEFSQLWEHLDAKAK